ncbi:alpha/beta hydrolase [Winogradskya consettensis]|uniref:alpha/beta hydrolase n=1 Tax=Winogradskya consettensis TaxID=113560 RepID=UPI001BB446AF|nr:alpha/beta hydrolase [Actinoplanes consettensis]
MTIASVLALVMTASVVAAPAPVPIEWTSCGNSAECATLQLPVDWSDPGGEKFGFRVARHQAKPGLRVGTLVFGPGGPGDSGVGVITDPTRFDRFSQDLIDRFDIVSYDPRGVGQSSPMPCPAPASPVIASAADFDLRIQQNQAAWAKCREDYGPLWEHADSLSTVRDIDALRSALGERQLTFHGSSYGTLVGELYAETYPSRTRAVVLESSVDHSQRTAGFVRTQAWALQDSFDAFAAWCDATESCALHGKDVHAEWAALLDAAGPDEVWDLTATAHRSMYAPDYAGFAGAIAAGDIEKQSTPEPATAVSCNDWALPVRDYASYQRLITSNATRDFRYSAGVLAIGTCLGWPRPVADPQHRLDVHTRTPLLLINARHDPASGYNWALSVAAQLGRHGVLLTYDGAGHGSYNRSTCVKAAVDAYLMNLTVPRRGTVC